MRTRSTWAVRAIALFALLVGAVALAACGSGGSGDGVASLSSDGSRGSADDGSHAQSSKKAKQDPEEAFRAFAQCMREHGIDMPDPQVSDDGKGGVGFTVEAPAGGASGPRPGDEAFKTANEACKKHLDGVVSGPDGKGPSAADRQKFQEQALAFAKCMRAHGIDMPDPTFQGDGGMIQIGPNGDVDPDDPKLKEATEACQKKAGLPEPKRGAGNARVETRGAA
jgi:hypothetical protein